MRTCLILAVAALSLAACGKATTTASSSGEEARFAGLDQEIKAWRTSIEQDHKICAGKTGDMACQDFQVACKAERTITPEEQAKDVTAKLVAAMTFNGKGEGGASDLKPGSSFAQFAKTGSTWTRTEAKPVNLSTCADF